MDPPPNRPYGMSNILQDTEAPVRVRLNKTIEITHSGQRRRKIWSPDANKKKTPNMDG
jgi:hypothetical protein